MQCDLLWEMVAHPQSKEKPKATNAQLKQKMKLKNRTYLLPPPARRCPPGTVTSGWGFVATVGPSLVGLKVRRIVDPTFTPYRPLH